MNVFRADPRTMVLAATAALLAAIVAIEVTFPFDAADLRPESTATEPPRMPDGETTRYAHPSFESYPAVLERPLFFPDRTLPPEPVVAQVTTRAPLNLVLEGIAIVGDARIAVLKDSQRKRLVQLSAGGEHDGWTLDSISADSATFSRDGETTELRLNDPE